MPELPKYRLVIDKRTNEYGTRWTRSPIFEIAESDVEDLIRWAKTQDNPIGDFLEEQLS